MRQKIQQVLQGHGLSEPRYFQLSFVISTNEERRHAFTQLLEACGIEEADAKRNLQSLACVKRQEILKKEPSGRDVAPDDVFTVNEKFSSKFTKIKVKTVTANKETADEVPPSPSSDPSGSSGSPSSAQLGSPPASNLL